MKLDPDPSFWDIDILDRFYGMLRRVDGITMGVRPGHIGDTKKRNVFLHTREPAKQRGAGVMSADTPREVVKVYQLGQSPAHPRTVGVQAGSGV